TVWALSGPDDTATWVSKNVGRDVHYVVAGHTHLRRRLGAPPWSGTYFNSGTWIALMRVPDGVLADDAAFDAWVDRLRACATVKALEEAGLIQPQRTVIVLDASGGHVDAGVWEVTGPKAGPFALARVDGGAR
ncbi:MAG TPA: hypothetical protein PKA64_25050, partial [Myxococcota bacterium]|nr:hypothetical protein [Myxococcota bacterium]